MAVLQLGKEGGGVRGWERGQGGRGGGRVGGGGVMGSEKERCQQVCANAAPKTARNRLQIADRAIKCGQHSGTASTPGTKRSVTGHAAAINPPSFFISVLLSSSGPPPPPPPPPSLPPSLLPADLLLFRARRVDITTPSPPSLSSPPPSVLSTSACFFVLAVCALYFFLPRWTFVCLDGRLSVLMDVFLLW